MARRPRIDLPGLPQHIVQRGNDRQVCFRRPADRLRFLHDLRALAAHHQCLVHAYVLMDNHVHLLVTPVAPGGIGAVMQALTGHYARAYNRTYGRTGTLWEGRYRSCPVDSTTYLLRCHRYIELNPVRAGMVAEAGDHPWSSYRANACGESDPLLTPHPRYLALAGDEAARLAAYRDFVRAGIGDDEVELIRLRLRRQHALGDERFRHTVESLANQPAGPLPVGRPPRAAAPASQRGWPEARLK